jgi:predicted ferric reductase
MLALAFVGLAAVPLLLAAHGQARERGAVAELAVGAGLLALAMLLMQFISSGRYEKVSGRAGIDATMRFHQLTAYGVLALAVLHPVFFLWPDTLQDLGRVPGMLAMMAGAPPLRSGVIALLLLAALVPMGMLRSRLPLRYEGWRILHALLAVGAGGASLHHALSVGGYSSAPGLVWFWALLGTAAMGSLAYVYFIKPAVLARRAYRVTSNREAGSGIRELVLAPGAGRPLAYHAGQFVWVSFGGWPFPWRDHPYSLASSPREGGSLRLLIKARGDFSAAAGAIAEGTAAYVDGPHGAFTLQGREADVIVLIAGGIGIAPILSILSDLRFSGDGRRVRLVYGARELSRLVGRDVIDAALPVLNLEVDYVLEEPPPGWTGSAGAITPERVLRTLRGADPHRCLILLCGPTPMMLAAERTLLDAGVPSSNIVYERFDYD